MLPVQGLAWSEASLIGRVFLDEDENGVFSDGDKGLEKVRIVTDFGYVVVTDEHGRFHLFKAQVGQPLRATHVLYIDRASLPSGVAVREPIKKMVQLTPHLVSRIDFALRPRRLVIKKARIPKLFQKRLRVSKAGLRSEMAFSIPANCRLWFGNTMLTESGQSLRHAVAIDQRHVQPHLLGLQCQDGQLTFVSAEIHRIRREQQSDQVLFAPLRRLAVCQAPGYNLELRRAINVRCRVNKSVQMKLPGARVSLDPDGLFQFELPAQAGKNRVELDFAYGSYQVNGSLSWEMSQVYWLSTLVGSLGAGLDFASQRFHFGGRVQGFLQARLPFDLRLNLTGNLDSFDTDGLSTKQVLTEMVRPKNEGLRMERDPDPESTYLAASDRSRLLVYNPDHSKYVVELSRNHSRVGFGHFRTAQSNGVGTYSRALPGAYLSLAPLDFVGVNREKMQVDLQGFFSPGSLRQSSATLVTSYQLHAHEEYLVTGGSLYFLAHGWIVEGSERITLQTVDATHAIPISRKLLRRGVDYQVDWMAGRLILTDPIRSSFAQTSAIRLSLHGTQNRILVVDYEYLSAQQKETDVLGGQVVAKGVLFGGLGIRAAIGAVGSSQSDAYQLVRTSAEIDYQDSFRVWGSFADSHGVFAVPAYSLDGGLNHVTAQLPQRPDGEAYQFGGSFQLDSIQGRILYRRYLAGYSDSRVLFANDWTQLVGQVESRLSNRVELRSRFVSSHYESQTDYEALLGAHYQIFDNWGIDIDCLYDRSELTQSDATDRLNVGLRSQWQLLDWLGLALSHQHSLIHQGKGQKATDMTLTSVTWQVNVLDWAELALLAGWGPEVGSLLQLGVVDSQRDGSELFAYTTFSVDRDALQLQGLSTGQRAPTENGWLLSSSQSLLASGAQTGQQLGLDVPISNRWHLRLSLERMELSDPADQDKKLAWLPGPFFDKGLSKLAGPGRRNTAYARLSFLGEAFLFSAAGELRTDEWQTDSLDTRQMFLRLATGFRPSPELQLMARLSWAETFAYQHGSSLFDSGRPREGFVEGSLGLSYRPSRLDWLRFLLRYSVGLEKPHNESLSEVTEELWMLASLAALFSPSAYFQPTVVITPWLREFRYSTETEKPRKVGLLSLLRIGSRIWAGLGLATELRLSLLDRSYQVFPTFSQSEDRFLGAAVEVFYEIDKENLAGFRFSLGYNFSDVPDPLLNELVPGRQGLYIRLEGLL